MQSVGAALGPPPPGVFRAEMLEMLAGQAEIGTENLLEDRCLPQGRACLEPLRLLSLHCLEWKPERRPVAQGCLEAIAEWLATADKPPSFSDLWEKHASEPVQAVSPEPGCPHVDSQPQVEQPEIAPAAPAENPAETAAGTFAPTCSQGVSQSRPFLKNYDSDSEEELQSNTVASAAPANRTGSVSPATPATKDLSDLARLFSKEDYVEPCACVRKNCTSHKGPCENLPRAGSLYCDLCCCREHGCNELQIKGVGFCKKHAFRACAEEMQLVRALGAVDERGIVDEWLFPADIQFFCKVCSDYIDQFEELDPVFEFIAAWLKHPLWINEWGKNKQEPNCHPNDLLKALHQTIRGMSGQHDPEASFNLRSGRGLGFSVCCNMLGVAEKALGAASPADNDLVFDIGSKQDTWRLLKVLERVLFFIYFIFNSRKKTQVLFAHFLFSTSWV